MTNSKTYIKGELEIDHSRGVIYFHASDPNWIKEHRVMTVLRICGLPQPIPEIKGLMLDINHEHEKASWTEQVEVKV